MLGFSFRQGAHHEAQKSTKTILPFRDESFSSSSFIEFWMISGAISFSFSFCAEAIKTTDKRIKASILYFFMRCKISTKIRKKTELHFSYFVGFFIGTKQIPFQNGYCFFIRKVQAVDI